MNKHGKKWNRLVTLLATVLVAGFGLLLGPRSAFSAVSVGSVSLTNGSTSYANGADVVIQGSGFGSSGPNVVLFDDFEKGTNGAPPLTGAGSAEVGQWSSAGNPATSGFSNLSSVSGSLAYQARLDTYAASPEAYHSYLETLLPANTTKLFISWWLYLPAGDNFPGQDSSRVNWKQMWVQGSGTADDDLVLPTFMGTSPNVVGDYAITGNDDLGYSNYIDALGFSRGTWKRLWAWVDAVPGGTGTIEYWELGSNGVTRLTDDTSAQFLKAGGAYERVRVNGYAAAAAPPSRPMFDDVYVASGPNAQARVVIGNNPNYSNCTKLSVITTKSWSDGQIVGTIRQGSFRAGDTAYVFVFDANGNCNSTGKAITIAAGGVSQTVDNPPSIAISSPSSTGSYSASAAQVSLAGSASDDNGVTAVTWTSNLGGSGSATNVSGNWSSWSIDNLSLQPGSNVITVTATDSSGQTATSSITVNYAQTATGGTTTSGPAGVLAWSANTQAGDSVWKDSSVSYCVRLLVQGSQLTNGGDHVQLGFQGRANGDYSIQEVSIAERDVNGNEGDVVDSTWTKVTFDGNSSTTWSTDSTTVPAGQVKYSDPIPFQIKAGNDYYVTFKIDTPSVYLNPPSTYRELYFDSADHAGDIDWSGNGYLATQDYHALASIYVSGQVASAPPPPTGLHIIN